jgi:tripartite ATP-independent transporter DctM subunit
MASGMPVAFAFFTVNILGALVFWGGGPGLEQVVLGLRFSVTTFTLIPLPLFILMGEIIFHSGLAPNMIDAVDKWIGRLPGRLGLVAVGAGVMLSTLTGASMSSCAMLGSTLVPEMTKRGYKKQMTIGPILGSGGLAMMIPPSGLAVFVAAIGSMSIGKTLVAIIIPGLIIAALYGGYIIIRCYFQPHLAPIYDQPRTSIRDKVISTVKYILPLGFILFMVIGVMILGLATPAEAAATGAIGSLLLALSYKKLNWKVVKESFMSAIQISGMILIIIATAMTFGQNLGMSGAGRGLINFAVNLPVAPIVTIIAMQLIVLVLGMFMDIAGIIMIALPLFMPVVNALGFDPVWFGVMFLLNMEMALTTPPFGIMLFVMKGVAPPDTTMGTIYRATLPFLCCDLIVMVLMLAFPTIVLWLPSIMR